MLKPTDHRETYVVSQSMRAIQLPTEGSLQRQDTLRIGPLQSARSAAAYGAQAFTSAKSVGLIRINSRWLNRMR